MSRNTAAARAVRAWHPKMAWAAREGSHAILPDLLAVDEWLRRSTGHEPVLTRRERSLEVFGDEKRLDALTVNGHIFGGRVSLEDLRCISVSPPLPVAFTGRAGGALVVENADTFHTMATHGPFSQVIYGGGTAVTGSIDRIPPGALYFGDIDKRGVEIALTLHAAGIRPHEGLYALLLQVGVRRTGKACTVDGLPKAFGCELGTAIGSLLSSGLWIPQESVNAQRLEGLV